MSAGMAGVIAAHQFDVEAVTCLCGEYCGLVCDEHTHAVHVAEELAKAGYGLVRT